MGRNDLPMDALAGLLDKQAIHELIMTYCRAVDRRDEAMMLATFHEDAIDDHGLADSSPKSLAAAIAASPATQLMHFIGNVLIELDGDQAYCESYFISISHPEKDGKTFTRMRAGRYIDRCEKRAGVWKFAHRKVYDEWSRLDEVNDAVPNVGHLQGSRDRNDPVYHLRALLGAGAHVG